MPIINLSNGAVGTTEIPGVYIPVQDTWTPSNSNGGLTTLVADGSNGDAIISLVQGRTAYQYTLTPTYLQDPVTFGGLTPDNSADGYTQPIAGLYGTTTTMPNPQAPLVNYIYCEGNYIAEVVTVIDDNTIVVKDPSGIVYATSIATIIGLSTNIYPIKSASIYITQNSDCNIFLPNGGVISVNQPQTIEIEQNNYGECSPVMVIANSGTAVLTYNE